MSTFEVRIITVGWEPGANLFDDSVLRAYLADREVVRAEPQFFQHGGRPYWSVYLETRTRVGAREIESASQPSNAEKAAAEAGFNALLSELDEVEKARYQRILAWRRDVSRREGVPHYTLCTNRQAMELCRRAPRTLQALAAVKGFGTKRVKKHGRELLEVLHGGIPEVHARESDSLRTLDGQHEVDPGANSEIPGSTSTHADQQGGEHDPGDSGGSDHGSVHEEPDRGVGEDQ